MAGSHFRDQWNFSLLLSDLWSITKSKYSSYVLELETLKITSPSLSVSIQSGWINLHLCLCLRLMASQSGTDVGRPGRNGPTSPWIRYITSWEKLGTISIFSFSARNSISAGSIFLKCKILKVFFSTEYHNAR